jgi:hypothetical protein
MMASAKLTELLEKAKAASPHDRISFRDPIAKYGDSAVKEMSTWLRDGVHPSFAVRVIGKAGEFGASESAIAALRAARPKASPYLRTDMDEALVRLGAGPSRGGSGAESKAPVQPDLRLYQRLIVAARDGSTLTYSEAGAPAEMSMRVPRDRALIGQMLTTISQREARAGRPMLSSIVVHKGEGSLGTGFFQLGQELEQVHRGEGARTFERRQQAATFEYWQSHPDAGPLDEGAATEDTEPDFDVELVGAGATAEEGALDRAGALDDEESLEEAESDDEDDSLDE